MPSHTAQFDCKISQRFDSYEFMRECVEVIRYGFGMPAFNNDEIIPSFIKYGVSNDDAYNYSKAIGCVENRGAGQWGYRYGMSFLNFPQALLIAMNNGVHPSVKGYAKDDAILKT